MLSAEVRTMLVHLSLVDVRVVHHSHIHEGVVRESAADEDCTAARPAMITSETIKLKTTIAKQIAPSANRWVNME